MSDTLQNEIGGGGTTPYAEPAKSYRGWWIAGIVFVVMVLLGLAGWTAIQQYNSLQQADEISDAEWSELLNQYKRRADLVPNLVTVAKSYAEHESKLFNELAASRAILSSISTTALEARETGALNQFRQAQRQLDTSLARLLVVAENYPELKSNELFRDLMVQLEGTENRISYARQRYIVSIAQYNLNIRLFPNNLIARYAGFKPKAKFNVGDDTAIMQAPKADLK